MFKELKEINSRPAPFQFYTADELWANEHTSKQMLEYHLNESIDVSSRNKNFIECSVDWIVSHFRVDDKTAIADFGCGPGLYTTRIAERGAMVTGIDFSENSLKYASLVAKQKGLEINYVHKNYLDFETNNSFDLITMIMCDFCALSLEQRKIMLSKFSSILKAGGFVLLDVYSLNSFNQKEESATYELNQLNHFWSPLDYYCFVNTLKKDYGNVTLRGFIAQHKIETAVIIVLLILIILMTIRIYRSNITLSQEIAARKQAEAEIKKYVKELEKALSEIKTLRGIIPICSYCEQIRDDEGYWSQVEMYMGKHTEAEFSHGVCPACYQKVMDGEFD